MICPYCLKEIDDDSAYCDQCGGELFVCPVCGKTGREMVCEDDHVKYISVSGNKKIAIGNFFKTERIDKIPHSESKIEAPGLIFSNKNIGIDLRMVNDDIIGRKSKKFSDILGNYKQISGSHAKVNFSSGSGWTIIDLNSSNGTIYNDKKLVPFESVKLQNETFITLADIEFYVLIDN
ncbi:MAG: FHA domain-containing protein [Calditrichaceae bacterium]